MTRFPFFLLLLLILILMTHKASPLNSIELGVELQRKRWDSMDLDCWNFCNDEYFKGRLDRNDFQSNRNLFCRPGGSGSPWAPGIRELVANCSRICYNSCYLACEPKDSVIAWGPKGLRILCPPDDYTIYIKKHGYRLTTTSTTTTTTEASTVTEILLLETETEKSSSTFLGEPGSVKFWISISAIIFFSIVIIILIIACAISAASKERNRIQQVAPESDSASYGPPTNVPKTKLLHYEKPPIRVKSPLEAEELYSKPVTPIRKGPEITTYPMPTQQQHAYQLVPMSLPGQTQQLAQGQQPMVIMLPANFDFSGGTPVLIPISGNEQHGGGTAAKSGPTRNKSKGHSHTSTEADDDDD